jgi:hypothetical protein
MEKMDVHVCLVSQQATPNLTPILAADFRPEKVILLVSPEMAKQADALMVVYKKYHIKCDIENVVDAYDIQGMTEQLMNLLAEFEHVNIGLNITGGTKPMAIAAQEAFRVAGKPIFYVNVATNDIQFISSKSPSFQLSSKLKIDDYLAAHGYAVALPLQRDMASMKNFAELTSTLVMNVKSFSKAIGQLNYLANQAAENKSLNIDVDGVLQTDPNFMKLVDMFSNANVLMLKGKKLIFSDDDARFYANGGWLEAHVFNVVKSITVQDAAANVSVENSIGAGHAKNELDVVFLAYNRLHLIECKTRNFQRGGAHGTDALYKLDSLVGMGGLNTRAMLVSYRALSDADKQRAKDLKIKTVEADELRNLKNILQSWIVI